ncbi:unnamed protein product (macronuclear) [Paramecium tetraurelia]|uniref:Uncharacterized protein n=1 Tax=Paramecium tetraurelia TaxID=5888 RepID=A0BCI7_PARTE|nr:uncharacterized protein GSPATT00004348001 [Paramecium tetraurelia]CAK56254.1 unnamed protein product [Paramecium tetraurelia]|eukprot:XP_001423652.1 hypothetical protein (macronuclear) [Paramecium tetraurelia strain d4-2]
MSDLIPETEYRIPKINSYLLEIREPNKNVLLNRTIQSKSQHKKQQLNATSSNHSLPYTGTALQSSIGQGNQSKDNVSIQRTSQLNKITEQKDIQNDMININQFIHQKKKEQLVQNQYFLKEIKHCKMKANIKNKLENERKSTTSSQDKYEKCWDETLKEMNEDPKTCDVIGDSSSRNNEEQFKRIKKPKRLKSQIFSKIREAEDQYFKAQSKSIIKLMKQRSLQIVDEVTAQIEQEQLLKKEQQYQRSKEREEGKQEIIKSLSGKEQGKLLKLLQNKQPNLQIQPSKQINDVSNSFSKYNKHRSKSFNSALPILQDKGQLQVQNQIQNRKPLLFNKQNLIENQDFSRLL